MLPNEPGPELSTRSGCCMNYESTRRKYGKSLLIAIRYITKGLKGIIMFVRKVKVCLLGDPEVGKTSLIRRFVVNKYDDNYLSTLGTRVSKKTMVFPSNHLVLMIWDLTGQVEFKRVRTTAYLNAEGAIIVGDMSRPGTIKNFPQWKQELMDIAGEVPFMLLGNKVDLIENKLQASDTMFKWSKALGAPFELTSAKTGENVEKTFQTLGKRIIESFTSKPKQVQPQMVREVGPTQITPLTVEDEIIMKFCEIMEDNELAMATVRKQFKEANVDFRKPTKEQLLEISNRLADVLKSLRGPETAKIARTDFTKRINKLDSSGTDIFT